MVVETRLVGAFPRSEELVAATRAAVRGNLPQSEVDRAVENDMRSLIQLEENSGLSSLVDGQLNWQDLFRPFSQIFSGIKVGGLARWFDNNTFYRTPQIVTKVNFNGDGLKRYFRVDLLPKQRSRTAILPGPLTFGLLAENLVYTSLTDLVDDVAHSLKEAVNELKKLGYNRFQFNEPCIVSPKRTTDELNAAKHAYQTCANGEGILQTYFGDVTPVLKHLLGFPIEGIGVDLYSTPLRSLSEYDSGKVLGCGCIDGRNSHLETPTALRGIVSELRDRLEPRSIYVTPNCDLDFLPRSVAEKKVALLSEIGKLES